MIEVVERLRQLKRVLGHVRRLAGGDGCLDRGIGLGGGQQHLPEIFRLKLAGHGLAAELRREIGNGLAALLELAQNVAGAHRGVLEVRPGFAFEAQRLLKIESDHRSPRELQQEVAQSADGDLAGHALLLLRGSFRVARCHFLQRLGDERVHEVVRLDALALAAGDFHIRTRAVFLR